MGKKPIDRAVTTAPTRNALGFEANMPCGACGAPTRRSHKRFRMCENGHAFIKNSDQ